MARPLRIDLQGGFYHVVARGWERRRIFRLGRRHGAMTLKELAREAGFSNYRGVGTVLKNFERRLSKEPEDPPRG